MNAPRHPLQVRTLWLSDIHLGTRASRANELLAFLRSVEFSRLYLVGDVIDFWRLKRAWYWPESHASVVREILRRAARGTEVVFIPGNHDESLREFVGLVAAGVSITDRAIHTMADGRRLLVLHGDEFDGAVRYARWLYFLGDWSYRLAIVVNRWFNVGRRLLGLPYWSLSAYLKRRVKNAVQFVANFETAVAAEAARQGTDGVVCGHIHHAELRTLKGVIYANDGDWVESCTALVEHLDGRLEIVHGAVPVSAPIPQYALAS